MIDLFPHIFGKIEQNPLEISLYNDVLSLIVGLRAENPSETLEAGRKLLLLEQESLRLTDDVGFLREMRNLYKPSLFAIAADDLDAFIQYLEWDKPPKSKIYAPRRRILKPRLVEHLQDLEDGEIQFLGVSMPPRTGKSVTCKFFMAWHMGRHPDDANIMCGYSGELGQGFYDDILEFCHSGDYLFNDVFPDAPLAYKSAEYHTIDLGRKHTYHTLSCGGIDGSWTGAYEVGANGILYVDDLIKDEVEASSLLRLEKRYQAYVNHLRDRKKEGARELMVGTRWNVFDPLGRVQAEFEGDERYRFVVCPALGDDGESNFQYDRNEGFSTQYYLDVKRVTEDAEWCAKYMGAPYVREGILYEHDSLRRYFDLPDGEPDAVISVCDTKDRGEDYCFSPVAYVYGHDYYIADCVCDNNVPDMVEIRLVDMYVTHKVQMCRFESNSAGGRIAKEVSDAVKEREGITHITTKFTTSNKETKIIANSGWVKEHCLFLDDEAPQNEDYRRMMKMLCMYSMSGKNRHDDVPDGMAMLAEFANSSFGNALEITDRRF